MIVEALIIAAGLFLAAGRIGHSIRRASRLLRDEVAGQRAITRGAVFTEPTEGGGARAVIRRVPDQPR